MSWSSFPHLIQFSSTNHFWPWPMFCVYGANTANNKWFVEENCIKCGNELEFKQTAGLSLKTVPQTKPCSLFELQPCHLAVQHSLLKELIQMEKDEANMLSRFINYSFESLEPCSSRFVEENCIKCGNELEFISTLDTILLYKSFLTLTDVLCVRCQYSE